MDTAALQKHLVSAEYHAAEGRRLVDRQKALVDDLKRRGQNTADAQKVLATLRDTLTIHEQAAQLLRAKLGFT